MRGKKSYSTSPVFSVSCPLSVNTEHNRVDAYELFFFVIYYYEKGGGGLEKEEQV